MKVLLIEDDPEIVEIVKITLDMRWPDVDLLSTFLGEKGIELAKTEFPDVIILDLGLPDTNGFEVLREIRKFSDTPVVILSVRGEELDKIQGLELGADDFVSKPFSPGELLARLQAVVRRSQIVIKTTKTGRKFSIRGKQQLRIDLSSHEVSIGDKLIQLSPRAFDLLHKLVTNEGEVLSRKKLMEILFPEHRADTQFLEEFERLEFYINYLREKLEDNPDNPRIILSEGETGYKFVQR